MAEKRKAARETEKAESKFSREQLLASARFNDRRDMVSALLRPEKEYGVEEVEQMIENYRKGQVN